MNTQLLIEIIQKIEDFDKKSPAHKKSLDDFRLFLNEEFYQKESPRNLSVKNRLEVNDLENEIAKQVILLGRYSKHLIKKAVESYKELSNDDFTYLYRLMDYQSLTKMQLIEKNAHEKQTGMEIIRLISHKLISEKSNPEDKRSKYIYVSDLGKRIFYESMQDITKVSKIMCGKLKHNEKEKLLGYLKKLNTFHHTLYMEKKNTTLDDIEALI